MWLCKWDYWSVRGYLDCATWANGGALEQETLMQGKACFCKNKEAAKNVYSMTVNSFQKSHPGCLLILPWLKSAPCFDEKNMAQMQTTM